MGWTDSRGDVTNSFPGKTFTTLLKELLTWVLKMRGTEVNLKKMEVLHKLSVHKRFVLKLLKANQRNTSALSRFWRGQATYCLQACSFCTLPHTAHAAVCAWGVPRRLDNTSTEITAWLGQRPYQAIRGIFKDQRHVVISLVLRTTLCRKPRSTKEAFRHLSYAVRFLLCLP